LISRDPLLGGGDLGESASAFADVRLSLDLRDALLRRSGGEVGLGAGGLRRRLDLGDPPLGSTLASSASALRVSTVASMFALTRGSWR
jgi:hypothetical protein